MNYKDNWVKISRNILYWEWYTDVKVKTLFLHLILECNYINKSWRGINIDRGQLITGRKKLSVKTGLSEQEVRTSLNKLISTKEITIERVNSHTLITLVNYNNWQSVVNDSQPLINQQSTTNQPQLKKEKKERKKINISTTTEKLKRNFNLINKISKECNIDKEEVMNKINLFVNYLEITQKDTHKNDNDLYKHFMSWFIKRGYTSNIDIKEEINWFIEMFNRVSRRRFKVTSSMKKLFIIQLKNGFTGAEMETAVTNLYSSCMINKFHIDSSFKFATPNYLLKEGNLNKYLNFNKTGYVPNTA